jgi:tripartite-type tricarboxylate transporter receptor subunit TctC
VRALALTSLKRSSIVPDVPTMEELGFKGHDAETITGMLVPAGTPGPIVKRLYGEAIRIMALPDIRQRVTDMGADIIANSPQQFTAQIKREVTRWGKVIKDAKIPAN